MGNGAGGRESGWLHLGKPLDVVTSTPAAAVSAPALFVLVYFVFGILRPQIHYPKFA